MGSADKALGRASKTTKSTSSSGSRKGGSAARALSFGEQAPADSDGGDGVVGEVLDGLKHTAGNIVGTGLQALDLGRSVVQAGAIELGDAAAEALTGHTAVNHNPDKVRQTGVSWKDFTENVKHHVGAGDYLEAGALHEAPINVKRAAGLALDIGTDPLTYVGAGAVGKGGAVLSKEEVARKLVGLGDEAIEKLGGREAVEQLANDVLKKGTGQLGKEAGEEIGVRTGVTFGTKNHNAVIPGSEALGRVVGEAAEGAKGAVRDRLPTKVIEAFQGVNPTETLRRGANAEGRLGELEAFKVRNAWSTIKNDAGRVSTSLSSALQDVRNRYPEISGDEIRRALEGGATDGAAGEIRQILDAGADAVERFTGSKVARRDGYLTHLLTPEGRAKIAEGLEESGVRKRARGEVFQHARSLEGTIEDINKEMLDKFGASGVKLFEENGWAVMNTWVDMVRRSIERGGLPKALADSGLGHEIDAAAISRVIKETDNAEAKAAEAGLHGVEAAANAGDTSATAADLAKVESASLEDKIRELVANQPPPNQAIAAPARAELDQAGAALRDATADVPPQTLTADPRLASLTTEAETIDNKLAAAQEALAQANKALETREPVGAREIDRRIAAVADAQQAVDDLVDRKGFLDEEIPHLQNKEGVAVDSPERKRALARVAEAEKVMGDKASAFDAARQSMARDVSERAAANGAELERLQARVAELGERAKPWDVRAVDARERARGLYEAAAGEDDPILRQIATLQAVAADEEAKAARLFKEQGEWSAKVIRTDPDSLAAYHQVIVDNFREMTEGSNLWLHPDIADTVDRVAESLAPKEINKMLRAHDQVLSRWRAWQLVSGGFHIRNFMTALFANGLAGMEGNGGAAYLKFGRALRAFNEGGMDAVRATAKDPEYIAAFEKAIQNRARLFDDVGAGIDASDVIHSGGSQNGLAGDALKFGKKGGVNLDPTALDFAPVAANFKLAGKVEKLARGPLFVDSVLKGFTEDEALARVFKFHFEYELSPFEQGVAKRVLPFYSWSRYNLPLQLEYMSRRPGLYSRYLDAKRNIELGSDEDQLVPQYFTDLLSIRTPFKSKSAKNIDGKNASIYLSPDLPFVKLAESFNADQLLAQLSPFLKTPLEASANKQYFSGAPFQNKLVKAPDAPGWKPVLAILSVVGGHAGLPKVEKGADGDYYMTDKASYEVEQALPILSRMRRLAPSEDRYQDRQTTTWLSTFLGVNSRTLSAKEQESERRRLQAAVSSYRKKLKDLGYDS